MRSEKNKRVLPTSRRGKEEEIRRGSQKVVIDTAVMNVAHPGVIWIPGLFIG
jgi:hypothetical protein